MVKKWKFYLPIIAVLCSRNLVYAGTETESNMHYVLTYAENQTEDYPTTAGAKYFAELVEKETDGRIKIVVKSGGTLGSETEVLDQIRYGGIDFARVSLSQFSDLLPEYNVLQLPYIYENSEHMWQVLDGELGEEFLKMSSKIGIIGLSWYDGGVRSFYTKDKQITSLKDFEGLRIRVQESSIMEDMVNALGAYAVKVPYEDVYSYLERDIVDGAENNWPSYVSMEHYEVAAYYTQDEHSRIPEIQMVSEHTWKQLSEEEQEIIKSAARKSAEYERELWKEQVERSKQTAMEKGVQIITISEEEKEKMREAVSVVYDKYGYGQSDIIEEIRRLAEK